MASMHCVRLAADNRMSGDQIIINHPTSMWHIARERHRNGRRTAQSFFNHRVEINQAIQRCVGRCSGQLLVKTALKLEILWLGEFPHQEAEPVACGVDACGHVVFAFGGCLHELEVGFWALELF